MSNARDNLKFAVEHIDHVFGPGYAKAHPELVAAFIQADGMSDAAEMICRSLDCVAENVRSDHPLMGETFDGLKGALEWIASAISEVANRFPELAEPQLNGGKDAQSANPRRTP